MTIRPGTKLRDAKAEAVDQFLSAGTEFTGFTALAASTRPEHNIVGIGVGRKSRRGKPTAAPCVRFYVERKVAAASMPKEFLIPTSVRGVATDVVETGRFSALAAPIAQTRLRPAKGGCSVGFQFTGADAGTVMAGTFGALVKDSTGAAYVLSNNHVLANENALPKGSPIFQPGLLDSGDPGRDQIATLANFITLAVSPTPNHVDAAIAQLLKPARAVRTILPKVGTLKNPHPIAAVAGMKVHKHGRTTGYRRGAVVDVSADVNVGYEFGAARFVDQMLIVGDADAFSAAGDSGALIVDRATGRATGLLFAGSPSHTIANHISDVLRALNVTLV